MCAVDEIRQLVVRKALTEAIQRFEQLREENALSPAELAAAYRVVSVAYRGLGNPFAAAQHAAEAARLAEEIGDHETVLMAWSNLLDYYNELGDTHLALHHGEAWLAKVDDWCPNMAWRSGRILYNLSRTYRMRRENTQVLDYLERALPFLRNDPVPEYLIMCLQNLAWVLYEAHLLERADAVVAECGELLTGLQDVEALRELLLLSGYRAFMAGDYHQAAQIAQQFLAHDATALQRFWAAYIMGASALALAQVSTSDLRVELLQSAFGCADVCLDLSIKLGRADLINTGSALRRRAHNAQNEQAG